MKRRGASALVASWILGGALPAWAQPTAPDSAAALFERGVRSFESHAYEPALEDFRKSLEVYPSSAAAKNAALCLRELGRYDEALELLEGLSERFSDLSAEEIRQNQLRIQDLSSRVGWIELRGAHADSQLLVDGRERGALPPGGRVRLTRGAHRIRLLKDGMAPVEFSAVATPEQPTSVDVDQRPAETPSTKVWNLGVEFGASVTPALGGDVSGCSSPCDRSVGAGGRVIGRFGRELGRSFALSIDAGYLAVGQDVDHRDVDATAVGNVINRGSASDSLSMAGGLVGVSVVYRLPSRVESFVRTGAGPFFGWVRDARSGALGTASESYNIQQSQRQPAYYVYLSLAFGVGFRPASAWRVGVGLDAMAMVALRQPQWDNTCGQPCNIAGGRDGDAKFPSEAIAGRFVMLVSPFVDAGYTF